MPDDYITIEAFLTRKLGRPPTPDERAALEARLRERGVRPRPGPWERKFGVMVQFFRETADEGRYDTGAPLEKEAWQFAAGLKSLAEDTIAFIARTTPTYDAREEAYHDACDCFEALVETGDLPERDPGETRGGA
jgi:hypothetical protein